METDTNDLISYAPVQHDFNAILKERIPTEMIDKRPGPGNVAVYYLTGHNAISLANRVFGAHGWSSEIRKIDSTIRKEEIKWHVCQASAIIRVSALGTFHEDVGHGSARYQDEKLVQEHAEKEAVTDGIKRALRQFGEFTGNCLYDKNFIS